MLRPDHEASWLALITLVLAVSFVYLIVNPLPRWLPQPHMATQPVARFEVPPVPDWPVTVPPAVRPGSLSLTAVAG